jgi:hypothetical protein
LTSKLALGKPEIGGTDPNITLYNNCTDDELHFVMPRGSGNYEDEGDETEQFDAIPTGSWRLQAINELEGFDVEISDVNGYEGKDGNNADSDEEETATPS